jgi:hypothetical protein
MPCWSGCASFMLGVEAVESFAIHAKRGLGEVDVYKDIFFRSAYKYGCVNLPDVLTSVRGDKGSQHFTFNELIVAVGIRF